MTRIQRILIRILSYFHLDAEVEDHDRIHQEILKGIPFQGTNLWILIFAILVASVGLNMNSTAVIIGAMLISPLMGPINGMGYSIATYDFKLLRTCIRNFSFAVVTSLVTSAIYFTISPVSTAHSELLARTSPTIYDVLIALFGGLAGIVAISSKNKGNVIPGVAIATALMPPLCTAGYGIATLNPKFFFGAIYLFTINTIFIALASLWVSQLLNFPIRTLVEENKKNKVNRIITTVILLVFLPSLYFGYNLVIQEKFNQNAALFVKNVSFYEKNFLMRHEIDANSKKIQLVYGGNAFTEEQRSILKLRATEFGITKSEIEIIHGLNVSEIIGQNTKEQTLLSEKLSALSLKLNGYEQIEQMGQSLFEEIIVFYPGIDKIIYAETVFHDKNKSEKEKIPVVIIYTKNKEKLEKEKNKLIQWIEQRVYKKRIELIIIGPEMQKEDEEES